MWSARSLGYLCEHLVNYHANVLIGNRWLIPEFLKQYADIQKVLGELHQDVFVEIKKNGLSYDDIGRIPRGECSTDAVPSGEQTTLR